MRYIKTLVIVAALICLLITIKGLSSSKKNDSQKDAFINNPFLFAIQKNYSDNFSLIGNVINSYSTCPLVKENIADPSFCFLRTVEYDGLTVNIFSFDVLQSGTAEYIVNKDTIKLKNGLSIGSTKEEVIQKLGKPYKIKGELFIWKSSNYNNYLVFTIVDNIVNKIRWHEQREPKYKDIIVWNTSY